LPGLKTASALALKHFRATEQQNTFVKEKYKLYILRKVLPALPEAASWLSALNVDPLVRIP